MLKGTKLYSILFNKCPRCHEGDFFETKNAFTRDFDKMHKTCPHCGERYEPEPGFYFGAMYVSYALYVALIITSFVGFVVVFDQSAIQLLYFLVPALVLLLPIIFRLARRIWINIFVKYRPTKISVK
jgi:uncharacterized protein (DUF983 family)